MATVAQIVEGKCLISYDGMDPLDSKVFLLGECKRLVDDKVATG